MLSRPLSLALLAFAMVTVVPVCAWAQTALPAAPPLSTGVIVVTLLSLLTGIVTQAQQSGKLFGQFSIPAKAMVALTLAAPFLGGTVAYLAGVAFSSSAIFYAVVAGVTAMLAASVPGIAVHASFVVPAHMASIRAAKLVKLAAVSCVAVVMAMVMAGCNWFKANEATIVSDITSIGKCELDYIATAPNPSPEGAVQACVGLLLTDAQNTFAWLEASTGDAGTSSVLGAKLRRVRAARGH